MAHRINLLSIISQSKLFRNSAIQLFSYLAIQLLAYSYLSIAPTKDDSSSVFVGATALKMQSTFRRRQCLHFRSPGNNSHLIFSFLHSWPDKLPYQSVSMQSSIFNHLQAFDFLPGPPSGLPCRTLVLTLLSAS